MDRVVARLVATVTAVVLLASAASAADGEVGEPATGLPDGTGIRLVDVPVEDAGDPRAEQYVVAHGIPGATLSRRVAISNGTDEAVAVAMTGAEARIEDTGFVILNSDEASPGSIADWIEVEPSSFVLAPQSFVEVTATITIPPGTPNGERYGAIVAQPPPQQMGDVQVVSRVGLRVYLSVGGDEPVTDFTIDTLTASRTSDGDPSIDVGVLNTGGRAIDVAGELVLTDSSGAVTAGPFPTALGKTLAPRSRGQTTVPLPASLAAGPWEVTATMRSGLIERVATATVTFPDEAGTSADPAESEIIGGTDEDGNDISEQLRQQRRTLLPIASLLILLALGALFLLLFWKRRDEEEDDDTPAVEAARGGADDGRGG